MIIRWIYNQKKSNLMAVLVLVIYILFLQFIEPQSGSAIVFMTLFQMGIAVFFSINRLFSSKNILDPGFWFPALFSVVNLVACIFCYIPNSNLSWFEPFRAIFQQESKYYLFLNAVALIAFYLGNMFILKKKASSVNGDLTMLPSKDNHILMRRLFFLYLFTIGLMYYAIISSGGLDIMKENRGVDQFEGYGGIAYLLLNIHRLFFYVVISFLIPLLFMIKKRKYFLLFFILTGLYVFPSISVGARSTTVFAAITLMLNFFIFHKDPKKLINVKSFSLVLCAAMLLIVFFGFIRNIQGDGFSDYLFNFFFEMSGTSSVGISTIHFFPDFHPYYFGETYITAFLNLIPNIFFGGNRPFTNPTTVFRLIFAPSLKDMGFGFSIFAEAYMNGGIISVFIFFFFFSLSLTTFYLRPKKNIISVAMVSLVFISTIWYLRGDSTAFVKILIFAFFIFKLISLGVKTAFPKKKNVLALR